MERDGYWNDTIEVQCPYCGERVEITLEPDVWGTMVQDCEVCCNPWRVRVTRADGAKHVEVRRTDGSE
jgi:prolyl-tRNA synthetase